MATFRVPARRVPPGVADPDGLRLAEADCEYASPAEPDARSDAPGHRYGHGVVISTTKGNMSHPAVIVLTQDLDTQDAYVLLFRMERIAAYSAESVENALMLARSIKIGIVLVDVDRPADWLAVDELRSRLPSSRILVLSAWMRSDHADPKLARRLGCSGYLAKPCAADTLLDAVRRVAAGQEWTESPT
jgi:ActR/RegA family two-component response regulator